MFRPRIIPVLLHSNGSAVKTKQFKNPIYLGDIVNTARIFSEFGADELMVLDINVNHFNTCISKELVRSISEQTGMPLAVGGGINSVSEIAQLINAGAEKVVLGLAAFTESNFVREAVREFGSSTISLCIDIIQLPEKQVIRYFNGTINHSQNLEETIKHFEQEGIGEIIIQSIDFDGMRIGYDIETLKIASSLSKVPIIALGGADSLNDIRTAYLQTNCTAFAASSMFVFHKNGVLISYPDSKEIQNLFIH